MQRYHTVLGLLAAIGDAFKEKQALLYPRQCLLFVWTVIVSHSVAGPWDRATSKQHSLSHLEHPATSAAPQGCYLCFRLLLISQ